MYLLVMEIKGYYHETLTYETAVSHSREKVKEMGRRLLQEDKEKVFPDKMGYISFYICEVEEVE